MNSQTTGHAPPTDNDPSPQTTAGLRDHGDHLHLVKADLTDVVPIRFSGPDGRPVIIDVDPDSARRIAHARSR
jgi:hypothetical protein